MRKNEITRFSISIRGYTRKNDEQEKRQFYKIETAGCKTLLEKLRLNIPQFKKSFIDIPDLQSQRYQKIGLEKFNYKKDQSMDFYHFRAGYIFREKENLHKININNKNIHKIKLGNQEYQYTALHFTLVPNYNVAIVDHKCHSRPTAYFLKHTLLPHLIPTQYMLSSTDIESRTTVKIVSIPKTDFETIVNTKLQYLRTVGIELAKPNLMKMASYEPEELKAEMDFFMEPIAKILSTFFCVDAKGLILEEVPFKKVRIQFALDEDGGKDLKPYKDGFKNFITGNKNSAYLKDTDIQYKDNETGALERALLSGATLADPVGISASKYDNANEMWKEQRECFFRNKDKIRGNMND